MDIGRIPPHDVDAEQAILGSMLTDKDAVIAALEILKEDAFYREDNKIIFRAITNLYLRNEPIDIITVKAELVEMGDLEKAGGIEYLAELPLKVPTTANIERYVKIVEEKYILRNLISTSNELIALGYDETEEVDSIMDVAERRIFDLAQKKNAKGYTSMKDVLVNSFVELEKLYNMKGNLIILAARHAMGKSAFAINIAANVAVQSNIPVAIFNLEMSKEQIGNRILCSEAMVDSNKIRTGQIDDEDWTKLAGTIGRLSDAPIYIDDTPGITITEIRAKCRKLKLEKEIGLVVIDYLQLIAGTGKAGSREQEISEISRSLKILAKELEIPVIAISQLSRGAEKREDKRPMLSDLRESGAIEQDADIVMFLYRDDYYNEDSEKKNVAEVIVAKQRSGSTGTVELAWLPSYTKFGNLDRRYYNQDSGEEG